jgi:voltage-gated potassium channel
MKFLTRQRISALLIGLCIIHIFIIGLIPNINIKDLYYSISITIIFIVSYLSATESYLLATHGDRIKLWVPILAIAVLWIAELFDMTILMKVASFTTFVFFLFIIIKLMKKVVASEEVTALEFTESINAYLLFGIAGSLIFNVMYRDFPGAFNMPEIHTEYSMSSFIYYTFVTLSTLGYGDITPVTPIARSMSIFFSVAGQLYMAMIVAVLVGKYLSRKTR